MKFRLLGVIALLSILWNPLAYGDPRETSDSGKFEGKYGDCYTDTGNEVAVLLDEKTVRLPRVIGRRGTLVQDEADLTLRLWVCVVGGTRTEYVLATRYTPTHPGHSVSAFYEAQLIQGPITYIEGSRWTPVFDDRTTPYYQYIDTCYINRGESDCESTTSGVTLSNPFTVKFVCNEDLSTSR